eukprot:1465484-Rhodomonas_salina.1
MPKTLRLQQLHLARKASYFWELAVSCSIPRYWHSSTRSDTVRGIQVPEYSGTEYQGTGALEMHST